MDARKKPQLIVPRAQKINTERRSEAPRDSKAKGSSAMGSGQNTAQRISGDNHMRVKKLVDKVKMSTSEPVEVLSKKKQVQVIDIISSDDDDEEEEEEKELEGEEEEDEEESRDGDEHAIVRVRKFEGCCMLAAVDRSNDHGVASRTRRHKALRRKNSQFEDNNDSKGTFSEPIDV
ncbi:unnamed protein product [Miscanthus lutarioriparius]|uniref:Uncharacterized protein n=1 Tax=Miscanthus lutarioriparius TaxID=422564 RepID=A0A811R1I0_9POAL|nr:unnamed protein product [Miscanthus lutarioriparius]